MTQTATIFTKSGSIQMEFPSPDEMLLRGVNWGAIDAFPTPAYWQYQVLARRIEGRSLAYKLGRTLVEEVAACLLGGHGIPAAVGIAAFEMLRRRCAIGGTCPTASQFEAWLREPLLVGGREIRYRFAAQKARYLAATLPIVQAAPEFKSGIQLRDWLIRLPGIGPKTASWVARNWMDADDVAILDIHIVRVGQLIGLFPLGLTVERHYRELEVRFLELSRALEVRASELDAVIWYEMASSPITARVVIDQLQKFRGNKGISSQKTRQPNVELTFA
ncbi:MAG: 8-oxoguanine DNA glycosylase [Betaproteobacteria bacterium]|nr:8-oxoguanine DNA glycosylase [Betaproteobacteria bacterium]